jgi:hypothetical protein
MVYSHDIVAKKWSNGEKANGNNLYTDGTSIWSYGTHFCIATKIKGVILFNTDKYSRSTGKHQGIVRGHCEGKVFECTTSEIRNAVNYPDEPVILTKYRDYKHFDDFTNALKLFFKKQGIRTNRVTLAMKELKKRMTIEAI